MEIVPLLVGIVAGIAKDAAAGSLRAFLTREADIVQRAIQVTCGRFPEVEGAETALRQWTSCEAFIDFFERVHSGDHDFDDEIVSSFIDEGGFHLPIDQECRTLATDIVAAFLSELLGALYRSEEGLTAFANRQEVLHLGTSRLRKKGFRGDVRAAGMSAMSLSDALPGGLTACGGPLASGLVT